MPGFFSVLRGMTGILKTSPRSFCDCLLPAHAASGPDVTARSLRCLDVPAQSLRCPPSLLRHPFAFRTGRPLPRLMYLFGLRPLHLSGTRLEGGHRSLSRALRFVGIEPTKQRRIGCWLAAIAKRSTPTRQSRSSTQRSAATRTLSESGCMCETAAVTFGFGRHTSQRLSFPLTASS
jgi:hypothetical protein